MNDAYAAGVFDGEGTIGVYAVGNGKDNNVYWSAKLAVHGTYRPLILALHEHFCAGQFKASKRSSSLGGKQGWLWQVCNKPGIESVLVKIMPFLLEKREQAEVLLTYCRGEITGEAASERMKSLKTFNFPASLGEGLFLPKPASEGIGTARTTWRNAERVRARVAAGERQADIARDMGLSRGVVSRIVMGKTYTRPPFANPA
jgi:hypothetical protein